MIKTARLQERFFRYIRCGSESGNEKNICLLLEDELEQLGMIVVRSALHNTTTSNGWNIYARLDGEEPPILFSAHMDTVAPGNNILPQIKDGIIMSQGNTILGADDKAGIAAIMEALTALVEKKMPHRAIEVLFTVCEEIGLVGSTDMDYRLIQSKNAIVLDSGKPGQIVYRSSSNANFHIEVFGKSAHAASGYDKAINALKCAAELVTVLPTGKVDEQTVANISNFFSPGSTNVISDHACFDMELRTFGDVDQWLEQIQTCVKNICEKYGASYQLQKGAVYTGLNLTHDHPFVKHVSDITSACGRTPILKESFGGNDGCNYTAHGMAALNIGTGFYNVHGLHECIAVKDLSDTATLVERLMQSNFTK